MPIKIGTAWQSAAKFSAECGQILAHRLLTRRERPDAVFCVTDPQPVEVFAHDAVAWLMAEEEREENMESEQG